MYCKLFIFGDDKIFALVQLPGVEFMKPGDIFLYKGVRYKVMILLRVAQDIEFNDKGERKYPVHSEKESDLLQAPLPEIYITDIPQF